MCARGDKLRSTGKIDKEKEDTENAEEMILLHSEKVVVMRLSVLITFII